MMLTFCLCLHSSLCSSCKISLDKGKITEKDFNKYLPWFLKDNPSTECPKGGRALYSQAVQFTEESTENDVQVGATFYMAFNKVLKTSRDFTDAMIEARIVADNITRTINLGNVEAKWISIFCLIFERSSKICMFFINSYEFNTT